MIKLKFRMFVLFFLLLFFANGILAAKNIIRLTLDSAVDIAMKNSYRIKRLEMNIQRTRHWLRANQAGLKSRVYMNLRSPDIYRISDYKWDSNIGRDVIVRQNTRRWQADLTVRQPVVLFGYPTNGYISLNYKVYRYLQKDDGHSAVNYYNRFYLRFEQPFFLPNRLKNDLEEAQLRLEGSTLDFIGDVVEIIDDIGSDYYVIFKLTHQDKINQNHLQNLMTIDGIARKKSVLDTTKSIVAIQTELAVANARENLLANRSKLRRELADMKQRLRINLEDSLFVIPEIIIKPIRVDSKQAIQFGQKYSPYLRRLHLDRRRAEIDVENQKGRNSFHVNLEMTYGLEKQNDRFADIWEQYDNSNSVSLNAYVPIWDWGQRKERIQAELINIKRNELSIEETKEYLKKSITNTITNLNEYLTRSLNMKQGIETAQKITRLSIEEYRKRKISLQDLLQIVNSQKDTEQKFIDVYVGYKKSLLDLLTHSYYDYEKNISLVKELNLEKK